MEMKRYKLGEIATVLAGGTPSTKIDKYWNGSIPWLSVKDFCSVNKWVSSTEKTITQEGFDNCPSSMLKKGDLILSARGTVGKIAMVDKNMAFNQSCFGLRAKKDFVTSDFLFYWFLNNQQIFKGAQQGNVFKSITLDFFEKTNAIIPPLQTQQKIVAVLSSLDDKIALNKRINARLEALAKRLYDYWFVQFDFPDKNGKPYKTSGDKMVWNEVLKREIPVGWEVVEMSSVIKQINTGLNPRDNFILGNGKIKYVTVKNLTEEGHIDFSNCDLVNSEAQKIIHERSQIQKGDILFASICPLGRCYLIQDSPEDWDINESVFSIRPNIDKITSEFLYTLLREAYYVKKMTQKATGSIFKGIRINDIEKIEIVLPPKEVINAFSKKTLPIFNYQLTIQKEIQKLTDLRDRLLPLLMNGQVELE